MSPCAANPQTIIDHPIDDWSFNHKLCNTRPNVVSRPIQKSVKFAKFDEIIEIPHFKDMSVQEIADIWFNQNELRNIRQECKQLIKRIEFHKVDISKLQETEKIIIRGLECFIGTNLTQSKLTRRSLYHTVGTIQTIQKMQGRVLPEFLAYHCRIITNHSQNQANAIGLCDASDIYFDLSLR